MEQHAGAYCAAGFADYVNAVGERQRGQWRHLLPQPPMQVPYTRARNFVQMAGYVSDMYKQNFHSAPGAVAWQHSVLRC